MFTIYPAQSPEPRAQSPSTIALAREVLVSSKSAAHSVDN
jgi:hypothetical protein